MTDTDTPPTDLDAGAAAAADGRPGSAGRLTLTGLTRRFGPVVAVDDVSLTVEAGQLVSFLGPSGCGKTTLLRLIAGLDRPDAGRIELDGDDISGRPAHRRDVGMVFQSLALFPHLDVARNIGYGLKIRGVDKATVGERVEELLHLVDLDGLGRRRVGQLSGGQRQRVAIARALARDPALFLLDEPMSALDANLRESLQVELRLLQQRLGITTVMVTHDQREAMTMSDVLVVLDRGTVVQAGPPLEVYRRPRTAFAARFLGASNLLRGRVTGRDQVKVAGQPFEVPFGDRYLVTGADATVSARPGDAALESAASEAAADGDRPGPNRLGGVVAFVRDLGSTVECHIDAGLDEPLLVHGASRDLEDVRRGDAVRVHLPPASCVLVDE